MKASLWLGELSEFNIPGVGAEQTQQDFDDLQLPASDVQISSLTPKLWSFASS